MIQRNSGLVHITRPQVSSAIFLLSLAESFGESMRWSSNFGYFNRLLDTDILSEDICFILINDFTALFAKFLAITMAKLQIFFIWGSHESVNQMGRLVTVFSVGGGSNRCYCSQSGRINQCNLGCDCSCLCICNRLPVL